MQFWPPDVEHTYRCDDTRGCVMQFWPADDEHTYRCDVNRGCVMQFWPTDEEHMSTPIGVMLPEAV